MKKLLFLSLLALLSVFSARAYDFEVDGIYYNIISDAEVAVTYEGWGNSYSKRVVIPAMVEYNGETFNVTAIGPSAFGDCSGLKSVTIPNSVTSIGFNAFSACSGLTAVTIPNSVTFIGDDAFRWCSGLTSITISDGVTSIGTSTFEGCSGLTSITIPDEVTSIGGGAFRDCSGLTSITLSNKLTSIGNGAFRGCSGLTSVTIPEEVTSVGEQAFSRCNSLVSVEWNAKNCQDFVFDFGSTGPFVGSSSILSIIFGNKVSHIPAYLCYDCTALTLVNIGDEVVSIGEDAFSGTSISSPLYNKYVFAYMPKDYSGEYAIPAGIQIIAEGAFKECGALTSVVIPNSITSIGSRAFFCSGLTAVEIPNSVTSIGARAFAGCENLLLLTIPPDIASIEEGTFLNCRSLTSVVIPDNVISIKAYAFSSCSSLISVVIPNSVTSIGHRAFMYCSSLESVTIGEEVASIGDRAFSCCSSLKSVEWNAKKCGNFTDSYDGRPFDGYPALTSIIFGNNVSHIPSYLCYNCDGLTSVIIPDRVLSIGESAFRGCSGLTSVTIGKEVVSIGARAFYCENLTSVEWNAKHCNDFSDSYTGPFNNTDATATVNTIESIMFGDKVEHIPAYLFGGGCNGLTSVTFGKSVGSIGQVAFDKCNNLRTVYSKAKNPPVCYYGEVMMDVFSVHETLYVPRGSKASYHEAAEWRKFYKIEEIGEAYTVTTHVNDESMGMVIGGGTYDLDEQVMLVAIPNQGYYFVKWDDDNTDNPRTLTVAEDITLTAIFAKTGENPPTANEETLTAAPFAYVQGRTVYLSDNLGGVEAFTSTGQRVYRGFDRTISLPHPGVYVLRVVADGRRSKVIVQ